MTSMNTTISRSDLRGFHKDLFPVVLTSVNTMGWQWRKTSSGALSLFNPETHKTVHVPQGRNPGQGAIDGVIRRVREGTPAMRIAAVGAEAFTPLEGQAHTGRTGIEYGAIPSTRRVGEEPLSPFQRMVTEARTPETPLDPSVQHRVRLMHDTRRAMRLDPEWATGIFRLAVQHLGLPQDFEEAEDENEVFPRISVILDQHKQVYGVTDAVADSPVIDTTEVPAGARVTRRYLVSEQPYMAKRSKRKGGGTRYESTATLERIWSDGAKTYRCADCDFESDNHFSIPPHRKVHERAEPPTRTVFDPDYPEPPVREYHPSDRLVRLLAHVIEACPSSDPAEVAKCALVWLHEREDVPTGKSGPAEPLTPEQTLERIRRLLDDGREMSLHADLDKAAQRIAELETQVAEVDTLRADVTRAVFTMEEAQGRAERAEHALDRVTADWQALQDLINRREEEQ